MQVVEFLGVEFLSGNFSDIMGKLAEGGVLMAPAAPALATIPDDEPYHQALKSGNVLILDSGLLCILLKCFSGINTEKLSGLRFLREFFEHTKLTSNLNPTILSVDPTASDSLANRSFLSEQGFNEENITSYHAPFYEKDNIEDQKLVNLIERVKPKYVIINLGGGVQERLGNHLKNNLIHKPIIICTGAAISFLTGHQARIPEFIDKLYLGWFARCIAQPKVYATRYLKGFKLFKMFFMNPPKLSRQ
jgi:exopolysaccharide biosynthesis WecB/TagA/CpsF family protein